MLRLQLQNDKSIHAETKKVYCLTGTRTRRRYKDKGLQDSSRRTICSFVEKHEKKCQSPIKWTPADHSQKCFCLNHQKLTPWWWRKGLISSSGASHHRSAARLAFTIEHQQASWHPVLITDKGAFLMCVCLMLRLWRDSGEQFDVIWLLHVLASIDLLFGTRMSFSEPLSQHLFLQWAHGSFHYITFNLIWLENVRSSWLKALLLISGMNRPKSNCASLGHDVMLYQSTKVSHPRRSWSWPIP